MKTKSILLYLSLTCFSFSALGQTYNRPPNLPKFDYKKWHFGFTLGTEFQNFRVVNNSVSVIGQENFITPEPQYGGTVENVYYYSELPELTTGFHVGIITSRRLGEYFNLRIIPSLSLGQRDLKSKMYIEESVPGESKFKVYPDEQTIVTTPLKSTYISLPILLKYKAVRLENMRPYIIAGTNFKFDLASDFDESVTLKKLDAYLDFGLGSDFYMQTFRLGIEIRFAIGLMNILETDRPENDPTPYITSSMSKIKAKTFTIAFNFE